MNPTDPDAMSKPADFEEVMGYSKNFGSSIDIGDATSGGWDVLKFIQDTHERVYSLNLKDRTKAGPRSVPWGEGDSHVKDILPTGPRQEIPRSAVSSIATTSPTEGAATRVADIKRCAEFAKAAPRLRPPGLVHVDHAATAAFSPLPIYFHSAIFSR